MLLSGAGKWKNALQKFIPNLAELINWFSNHTLIEIDRCSPLELLKLQENLKRTTERDGIRFVYGKGKQKTEIQKLYDELELCGSRLMEYKE